MTHQEADYRITEILNVLARLGYLPPPGRPFVLRGGQLRAAAHPELPTYFRPLWEPDRPDLRPLDLEDFTVDAAAKQVARYGRDAYLPARRKLEGFMDALQGDRVHLVESHGSPDSFLAGDGTLAIAEVDRGRTHEPEFRIEFTSNTLFQELSPGEAPADSRTTDVTEMLAKDVVRLVKGQRAS